MATNSKFGCLLSLPTPSRATHICESSLICSIMETKTTKYDELNKLLPRLWDIDVIVIQKSNNSNNKTINNFNQAINFNHPCGRYTVRFSWKENKHELSDNYGLSKKGLIGLINNLQKKCWSLIDNYNDHIQEQLKLGFIEIIEHPHKINRICHYIPHFPVFKDDSATTKMHIVYNASAKASRNVLWLPNLLQKLPLMLLTFRIHQVGFTADILEGRTRWSR